MTDLYSGARIFTADRRRWAEAMVVDDGLIVYVGDEQTARRIAGRSARTIALQRCRSS